METTYHSIPLHPLLCLLVASVPWFHWGSCRFSHWISRWFGPGAACLDAASFSSSFQKPRPQATVAAFSDLLSRVAKSYSSPRFPVMNLDPVPQPVYGAFCPCYLVGNHLPGSFRPRVQQDHGFILPAACVCSVSGSKRY